MITKASKILESVELISVENTQAVYKLRRNFTPIETVDQLTNFRQIEFQFEEVEITVNTKTNNIESIKSNFDACTDTKVWLELSTQPFKPIDILNKAESFEVLTWTDESSITELQANGSLQTIDSGKLFSFELNDFSTIDNIEII